MITCKVRMAFVKCEVQASGCIWIVYLFVKPYCYFPTLDFGAYTHHFGSSTFQTTKQLLWHPSCSRCHPSSLAPDSLWESWGISGDPAGEPWSSADFHCWNGVTTIQKVPYLLPEITLDLEDSILVNRRYPKLKEKLVEEWFKFAHWKISFRNISFRKF